MRSTGHILSLIQALLFLAPAYGQHVSMNYVSTEKMLDSIGSTLAVNVTTYDGYGRREYTIVPSGNGMYSTVLTLYDTAGRECGNWLPAPVAGLADVADGFDIESPARDFYGNDDPLTTVMYDGLGRTAKEYAPGEVMRSENICVRHSYRTNAAGSVRKYADNGTGVTLLGFYAAGDLASVLSTDEDGKTVEVFRDRLGRTVLERRGGLADTYYIYNAAGRLSHVLSPQYDTDSDFGLYGYRYRYDARRRVIEKKLPGCGETRYWYDNGDRMTYMQDVRLRERGRYRFVFYDRLGREAIQGTCGNFSDGGGYGFVDYSPQEASGGSLCGSGYVPGTHNVTDARLEACTFYDNYQFLSSPAVPEQVRAELAGLSGYCAQGLVTGSITASSGGGYVYSAVYYDARGRETASREVRPTGTVITRHVSYNFSGTPKEIIQEVKTPKGQRLTSLTEHVYSCHTGLPTETYLTLDGGERHRTASLSYDAVGRIAGNVRGGNAGSVTYGYSMRGLPEVISSPQFTEWLSYDGGPGTPLYGGDISSMRWKTGDGNIVRGYIFSYDGMGRLVSGAYGEGDNIADNAGKYTETVTGYTLNGAITGLLRCGRRNDGTFGTVDELEVELEGNRAVNVTDRAGNMIYNGSSDFRDRNGAEPEYTYDGCGALTSDINGDIQAVEYDDAGMPRRIRFGSGSVTEYAYSATGQKLGVTHRTAIRDIAVSRDTLIMEEPVLQLDDMMPARTDGAGMVSRGTRDYGQVSPGRMMLEENTEYAGDFILKDGMPYMLLFDGGFCLYKQAAATGSTPEFFFYTKDHLGSNRTVVSEAGKLVQVTHYYPFGGVFGDEGMDAGMQPYKYNGKELDHMHGLDRYDYGARMFAPELPLWNAMDPMCEEYYHTSPYAYCMNNPVNNIDPDGRKIVDAKGNVLISFYKGNILYSKYANQDIRRVANSMSMTRTGLNQLKKLVQSKTNIQIELINESKIEGRLVTYGETIQGNYNPFDNYGRKMQNGQYVLKNAKIKVYLGSIEEAVKEDSGLKYEGLTVNEALGSVMSHEAVHCTDINEIDKDIKYEIKNNKKARPDREILTNKIEKLIMEELKEQQ